MIEVSNGETYKLCTQHSCYMYRYSFVNVAGSTNRSTNYIFCDNVINYTTRVDAAVRIDTTTSPALVFIHIRDLTLSNLKYHLQHVNILPEGMA